MSKLSDIPLRERKFAKTKLQLLYSMLNLTENKQFSEISIKELCNDVEISEATFFNYFPKKEDLLIYFIKIWSWQVFYLSETNLIGKSGLEKIDHILEITGDSGCTIGNKRIMGEIISYFALKDFNDKIVLNDVTKSELLIAFPDYEGIENMSVHSFDEIFLMNLKLAVEQGELPRKIDYQDAMLSLAMIFFGVPLLIGPIWNNDIALLYKQHTSYLWKRLKKE